MRALESTGVGVGVDKGFAGSDALDSGFWAPVALILSGAFEFSGEEAAGSCADIAVVGSSRKNFAHVVGVIRLDAFFLDSVSTRLEEFTASFAVVGVGVHDAARVASAS